MDPSNPYTPPRAYDYEPIEDKSGSYILGFLAGMVFALLGLILVYVFGKPETKRGALHGFLVRIGLVLVIVFVMVLFA
jgi:hypothetical protein